MQLNSHQHSCGHFVHVNDDARLEQGTGATSFGKPNSQPALRPCFVKGICKSDAFTEADAAS